MEEKEPKAGKDKECARAHEKPEEKEENGWPVFDRPERREFSPPILAYFLNGGNRSSRRLMEK